MIKALLYSILIRIVRNVVRSFFCFGICISLSCPYARGFIILG